MNTNKEKKLIWFKFYPNEIADFLELPPKEAAKRFHLFITRLISNKAPEGTVEAKMIADSKAFCDKQRERILKRWNNRNNGEADDREAPDESHYAGDCGTVKATTFSNAYAGRNGLVRLTDDDYAAILHAVGNKREADRLNAHRDHPTIKTIPTIETGTEAAHA